jgi:hypothetical protein
MNNVLLALGSILGITLVTKKDPKSKFSRSFERLKDYGYGVANKVADTSVDIFDEGFDTAKDVFQILDNDEVPSADPGGIEGANAEGQPLGDGEDDEVEFSGISLRKSQVLAPNDEADQMTDLGFTKQFSRGKRGFDPNMEDIMDDFKNDY